MKIWQGFRQWIRQWWSGPPDVYYVQAPEDSDNDAAMRAALRELQQRADKRRLGETMERIADIHAEAADAARSIRGIK